MLTFRLYFRTAWNDYFTGSPTNYNSQTHGTGQTLSGTNVYVSNCLFRSITSTSNGGAFYCSSVTCLLVESSSFFSCKTSANLGGAIHFYNYNSGECVLYKVCAYDCCSNYEYQFAYIFLKDSVSGKDYVNYSSIVRCVNENSNSRYTFSLFYGNIRCPSDNISMNKCNIRLIPCYPAIDSNSVTCSFSHTTFTDNTATGSNCFYLYRPGPKYEIKSCNILRNTEGSSGSGGIIYAEGNLMINDCCILENTATYIFFQSSSSYTITLSNCTVDKTTNNQKLVIQNTATKSFIHGLNHMSTRNCNAEYDSVGTLIPNMDHSCPSIQQIHCYTFRYIFIQSQLRDFISLICVFLFNFINLDASNVPLY
jgi:hypothetical protein